MSNQSGASPLVTQNQTRAAALQGFIYALTITGHLFALSWFLGVEFSEPYQLLALLSATFSFLIFRRYDLAAPWNMGRHGSIGTRLMYSWGILVGFLLFIGYLSQYSLFFSRLLLLLWILTTPLVLLVLHFLVREVISRFLPHLSLRRSAVIVFINDSARALATNLRKSPFYELVGFFDDREPDRVGGALENVTFLGKARNVAQYVRDHDIQVVFVVLPDGAVKRAIAVLDELGDTTASVYYVPDFFVFNLMQAQVGEVEGIPVLQVAETPLYGVDGILKQMFDVGFSFFALLLLAIPLLLIALAVKLDSPGPVLFKQKRYGLNGKRFWVYKFRSMRVNAPNADSRQASRDDDRITRVGRFIRRTSLDELPQFWNVLRGDMSVVGPRPHTVAHNEHYRKEVKRYMVRHKVKPGVTGWAQVNGLRGETAQVERMEERIRFDLEYIKNWSPLMDIKIICMTVLMMLKGDKNAF